MAPEGPVAADLFHLSPYFPPDIGGLERVALELAQAVAAVQPVTVLTTRAHQPGSQPAVTGRLHLRRFRALRLYGVPLSPGLWLALLRLPRSSVVHAHLAQAAVVEPAWIGARLRGYKLVVHFHMDIAPSSIFGPVFVLYKRTLMARVLRGADRVIVLSEEQRQFLQARCGVEPSRIEIITNGVSANLLAAGSESTPSPPDDGRRLRLLFVGRLSPQKNLDLMLDALELVERPVTLRLVGEGPERSRLEERVARSGLDVEFAGAQDQSAVIESLRWADLFALTSEREGMPVALLEAMALGVPIVATAAPGVREAVGDAAWLTESTPGAFAAGIELLAGDSALRERLAKAGLERARDLDWPSRAAAVVELYRTIVPA